MDCYGPTPSWYSMTHLIMVRGPSCVGKSTLARALAGDPGLDIEYVLSDRMTYYAHGKWGAGLDFGSLGRLAKTLLDEQKRDLVVEECFRDRGNVERFLAAVGKSPPDPTLVVVRLDAKEIDTIVQRSSGRPDKEPGDTQRQLDVPYWDIPGELVVRTDGKDSRSVLEETLEWLRPRICRRGR